MPLAGTRWLSAFRDGLTELLYPHVCWACGRFFSDIQARLCPACAQLLAIDPQPVCPRCAHSVGPNLDLTDGCVLCRETAFAFDRALRMGPYDGLLRDVILRLKNSRDDNLAEVIGTLWADRLAPRLHGINAQVVVPVPLHWTKRYWERGFNQSAVLARCLARRLGIPWYAHSVRRLRRTPRQSDQETPAARQANVHGAFKLSGPNRVAGKNVLLVDDVLTTGATANEVAKALKRQKPASITVVVLACGRS